MILLTSEQVAVARQAVALHVASQLEPYQTIGLGTGNTVEKLIAVLAEYPANFFKEKRFISTSVRTSSLASKAKLPIASLDELKPSELTEGMLEITIDGADEVLPDLSLLKGGGGALLREKIVAAQSNALWVLVDSNKWVQYLGQTRGIPVEVTPFGVHWTYKQIQKDFPGATLRRTQKGELFCTDGGNFIVDVPIFKKDFKDAKEIHTQLKMTVGVIETGIFLEEASVIYTGNALGQVQVTKRAK